MLAAVAGVIAANPAAAQDVEPEPGIQISTLDIDRYPDVIMEIVGVDMFDPLDPELITITEDGKPVPSDRIQSIAAMGDTTTTGVVLVIDASNSMRGSKLADAKEAALAFVEQKRPQDEVAVIAFGPQPLTSWASLPTSPNSAPSLRRSKSWAARLGSTTPYSRLRRCLPLNQVSTPTP